MREKVLHFAHLPGEQTYADLLTKVVKTERFRWMLKALGLRWVAEPIADTATGSDDGRARPACDHPCRATGV